MTPVTINGRRHDIDLPGDTPLLWALRDELGLTGTKFGCGMALCGACTVHLDGQAVRSCMTPLSAVANKKVTTIEAIEADQVGKAVQTAWIEVERASVRLLPGRPDHVGDGAAQAQPEAERRRHRQRHGGEHLPLRHLHPHPYRDQAGRRPAGSEVMSALRRSATGTGRGKRRQAGRDRQREPARIPPGRVRPGRPGAGGGIPARLARGRSAEVRRGRHAATAGSTTPSRSSPSRTMAPYRSSATAPRWDRACGPGCR